MKIKNNKLIELVSFLEPDNTYYRVYNNDTIYFESNSYVKVGDLIKTNTYSSTSGNLYIKDNLLLIKNDFQEIKDKQEYIESILKLDKDSIINKLNFTINNELLVINMTPYLSDLYSDLYLLNNYCNEILDCIELLRREFNIKVTILVPKYNKVICDLLNNHSATYPNIKFKYIYDKFPNTNNELLKHKYYNHKDTMFLNIYDIYSIYYILKNNMVLDYKFLNISGSALNKNYLLIVKKGTSIKEILINCVSNDYKKYYYYKDNILLRDKIDNIDECLVDDIDILYIECFKYLQIYECIRCGKCSIKCPYNLDPRKELSDKCIKCGICNLVCPSHINLVNKGEYNEEK